MHTPGMEERRQDGEAVACVVPRLCDAEDWRPPCERHHLRGRDEHPVADLVDEAGHREEGTRTHRRGYEVVDRERLPGRQPRGRRGGSRAAEEWSGPRALPGAPSWRSGGRARQGTRERRVPGDRARVRVPGVDGLPFGGRARCDVGRDRPRCRSVGDSGGADEGVSRAPGAAVERCESGSCPVEGAERPLEPRVPLGDGPAAVGLHHQQARSREWNHRGAARIPLVVPGLVRRVFGGAARGGRSGACTCGWVASKGRMRARTCSSGGAR